MGRGGRVENGKGRRRGGREVRKWFTASVN